MQAKNFQGKLLRNVATKLEAVVSGGTIGKITNAKVVGKSESPATHSLAVTNLNRLFERAVLGWSKPGFEGAPNINAIHRFFSPMVTPDNCAMLAKRHEAF